jgi:hypothetical protein
LETLDGLEAWLRKVSSALRGIIKEAFVATLKDHSG